MIKIKTVLTDLTSLVKVSHYVLQTFTDDRDNLQLFTMTGINNDTDIN